MFYVLVPGVVKIPPVMSISDYKPIILHEMIASPTLTTVQPRELMLESKN